MAYAHDSSGRVLYESTSCVAVLLTRIATGLATLVASGADGTENVGGAATVEGQTMTQIITQAKVHNIADHLCSCLGATGSIISRRLDIRICSLLQVWSLLHCFAQLDQLFISFPLSSCTKFLVTCERCSLLNSLLIK